jgi:hypothetical protein
MITGTLAIDAATVWRPGQACKLCGGLARPFDSVDSYRYCSPTDCFAFGFAGIHVEYRRSQNRGFIFTAPRALRGAPDDTELGLAIAIYPWVPPDDGSVC